MTALSSGDVVGPAYPVLTTRIALHGYLTSPISLSYQIWSRGLAPTQVWPALAGSRAQVDLDADLVGIGEYVARWTVPPDPTLGRYEVRWFAEIEDGAPEQRWVRPFEVLASASPAQDRAAYALVSDVRAEGSFADVTDDRISESILSACELIDTWTGRSFVPIYKQMHVRGLGKRLLPLREPVCAVDSVSFDKDTAAIPRDAYRVYSRHLTEQLRDPDDREAPALEFVLNRQTPDSELWLLDGSGANGYSATSDTWRRFYGGTLNVVVSGAFGYTEFDGSPLGRTPRNVTRAAILLALRQIFPQTSTKAWWQQNEPFITEKRTREQSVTLGGGAAQGGGSGGGMPGPVGDPEIDRLIMSVMPGLRGTGI